MTYVTVLSFCIIYGLSVSCGSGFQVVLMALPWWALLPEGMVFLLICVVLYLKIYLHFRVILPSVPALSSGLCSILVQRNNTLRNPSMNYLLQTWAHLLLCCFYTALPYFINVLTVFTLMYSLCHTCLPKLHFFCPCWTQITF